MITFRFALALAAALGLSALAVRAAPAPKDPKKQTEWGLYLTAKEAYDMKKQLGKRVLFVDVREPVEIMFTGFTDIVDVNVPYLLVNPSKWNPKKPVLSMERNRNYVSDVAKAIADRGLAKDAPVILMCRSGGTRGAPSARALKELGLEKVYVVVDGFEGSTDKRNAKGPWRVVNGWKNAGLPWSYKLNPEKVYTRSEN
jgi:rhodanese-related sulfurtransferase